MYGELKEAREQVEDKDKELRSLQTLLGECEQKVSEKEEQLVKLRTRIEATSEEKDRVEAEARQAWNRKAETESRAQNAEASLNRVTIDIEASNQALTHKYTKLKEIDKSIEHRE